MYRNKNKEYKNLLKKKKGDYTNKVKRQLRGIKSEA